MYRPRIVDSQLQELLESFGAVVIEGPKACGKTETAQQVAASKVRLDVDDSARQAALTDPSLILAGAPPRLIDEWQLAPNLWNHVRREVDDRRTPGQFILTGSATPSDEVTRHTGAGRFVRFRMRPMSLFESDHSTGEISLKSLLEGEPARAVETSLTVADIADRICVGGWPGFQGLKVNQALTAVRGYLDQVRRTDIQQVDGVSHDPERVLRLLRSFSRNVSTLTPVTTLAKDVGKADPLARNSVQSYLDSLSRLMVVEDQPPWAPHLRSKARVQSSPKRLFVDPSLAVAALRANPAMLLNDLNYMGFLFESLVVRDLRIYAQSTEEGEVYHYRDDTDLEVDAIVQAGGRWGAIEVKLGLPSVDQAAESLLRFVAKVDTGKMGPPAFLAVVVGSGFGYRREDGINVVPIGALGP